VGWPLNKVTSEKRCVVAAANLTFGRWIFDDLKPHILPNPPRRGSIGRGDAGTLRHKCKEQVGGQLHGAPLSPVQYSVPPSANTEELSRIHVGWLHLLGVWRQL
jgi:hypothetical protein